MNCKINADVQCLLFNYIYSNYKGLAETYNGSLYKNLERVKLTAGQPNYILAGPGPIGQPGKKLSMTPAIQENNLNSLDGYCIIFVPAHIPVTILTTIRSV